VIRPLLAHPLVEYIGEIGELEKDEFLGNALALLLPLDWPEPFGLVMIEAMAAGTPVIAFRCGSVPEIVEDGVTGYIVRDAGEAVAAIERVPSLSRAKCREAFDQRFTVERMCRDYLKVYELLQAGKNLVVASRQSASAASKLAAEPRLAERLS
ncbi:MAG: glycosyltransferase, partial [Terriglobia bacterium]